MLTRDEAAALDEADPLAHWRDRFVVPDVVYLDGNSLGMAPRDVRDRLDTVIGDEWATSLIGAWDHWVDLPTVVGDRLAPVIGAAPGTVAVHDSTTVNLYQAIHAALGLQGAPQPTIAVDADDFPTDRYVVAGIAAATGATVVPTTALDDGADVGVPVDVMVRSLVDYRTAARLDLAAETARCRRRGAVVVWDLSHAAGAVDVNVAGAGVDLAVGCSYKYLNGGPGAPAWTYVRPELHDRLTQPIWGWFAQRDQFEMGDTFDAVAGPRRFLLGTPGILALAAAEVGIAMVADAGIAEIAAKGRRLTAFALDLADQLGLESPTPRDPDGRGAHIAVRVASDRLDAHHAALTSAGVIVDKRRPDLLRVGCSALTTRFVDVFDGIRTIASVVNR